MVRYEVSYLLTFCLNVGLAAQLAVHQSSAEFLKACGNMKHMILLQRFSERCLILIAPAAGPPFLKAKKWCQYIAITCVAHSCIILWSTELRKFFKRFFLRMDEKKTTFSVCSLLWVFPLMHPSSTLCMFASLFLVQRPFVISNPSCIRRQVWLCVRLRK